MSGTHPKHIRTAMQNYTFRTFDEESKKSWYCAATETTQNEIMVGCLQRIASSMERMVQIHERFLDKHPDQALRRALDRIAELEAKVRDREAEILRIRTHETQAAHQLDRSLTPEQRADFTRMADRIAELERMLEDHP